jgi:hypothetical protein
MYAERHVEQYGFQCPSCNYEWLVSYEVRTGARAGEQQFFYLYGLPATPPAAGRLCPNCWTPSYSCQKLAEPSMVSSRL